ncbi:MAG: gamma carbonic anhydrase family protein [Planctomycetota bacterium]
MLIPFNNIYPRVGKDVFIAEGARIVGRVTIGDFSSVWFNTVIRGDVNDAIIGNGTNIQDLCICHQADEHPLRVGNYVTIGHSVTLHGCTIEEGALIGIGSTLLNGVKIGEGSIIAAQSLIPEGMEIPPRVLVRGIPGKVIRELKPEEIENNRWLAEKYIRLSRMYLGIPTKSLFREKS